MKRKLINCVMSALTLILVASCYAAPKRNFRKILEIQKETGYGKVIPDSIADIIISARTVTCELKVKNPETAERIDSVAKLPKKLIPTIKYLLLNSQNFQTDLTVYSPFAIWAQYKFKTRRGKEVSFELDFGTRRWRLANARGVQICKGDMEGNNNILLDFTQLLFPEDETLVILKENLKAVGK